MLAVGCMLWFGASVPLPVSLASVSYDADVHEARVVMTRPRSLGSPAKDLDTCDDPPRHAGLQAFEFAPSRAREDSGLLSHAAAGDLGCAS